MICLWLHREGEVDELRELASTYNMQLANISARNKIILLQFMISTHQVWLAAGKY